MKLQEPNTIKKLYNTKFDKLKTLISKNTT